MYETVQDLYNWSVTRRHRNCYPAETAECEKFFAEVDLDLIDAKNALVELAAMTAFREGLRLGLGIAMDTALDLGDGTLPTI